MNKVKEVFKGHSSDNSSADAANKTYDTVEGRTGNTGTTGSTGTTGTSVGNRASTGTTGSNTSGYVGNPLHGSNISGTGGSRTGGVDTTTETGKLENAAERATGAGNRQSGAETTAAGLDTYGTRDTRNAGVTGGNTETGTGLTGRNTDTGAGLTGRNTDTGSGLTGRNTESGAGLTDATGARSGAASSARARATSGGADTTATSATSPTSTSTTGTSHTSPVVGAGNLSRSREDPSSGRAIGEHKSGHGLSHTTVDDNADYDSQHLQHVTHQDVRHLETEEVERQRQHDVHVHHVQHHVQPVKDQEIRDEVHHNRMIPTTNVHEVHSSTQNDKDRYRSLGNNFKDEERHLPTERTVVDRGERVNEVTHHHVHQVIQPVVEREVHDRHRIHTVIPTKHTTHEAPIIHKSTKHEPVHIDQFLAQGGKLDSKTSHDSTGLLHEGDCSRKVEGVGEDLARSLNLSNAGTYEQSYGSGSATRSGTTGEKAL